MKLAPVAVVALVLSSSAPFVQAPSVPARSDDRLSIYELAEAVTGVPSGTSRGFWKGYIMDEYRQMAIEALKSQKGDDTYRAKLAFRNCTPEQMQQEHGESGESRQTILDRYISTDAKIDEAIKWLEGV